MRKETGYCCCKNVSLFFTTVCTIGNDELFHSFARQDCIFGRKTNGHGKDIIVLIIISERIDNIFEKGCQKKIFFFICQNF